MSPIDAEAWSSAAPPRLLASPVERGLYLLAWCVFTVGFAAVFWLQNRVTSLTSLLSAVRVVLPAALLGIAVVRLAERVPLRRPIGVGMHVVGALVYPAAWIGGVNLLNNGIAYVSTGVLRWRLPPEHVVHWHYLAGVMIYASLAALTYGRSRVFQAERERLWAEWRALRPQLQPHFLFNTLHSVFGLAQLEPANGEAALTRFSRVLRYTLVVHREDLDVVSLRDEWNFVDDYLHLESLRLDGRLSWRADISDEAFELAVPALLVQPLVENAVRHSGVVDSDGITIVVVGRREGDVLVVEVSDNGRGGTTAAALGSTGIGLRAARMRAQWQGAARDAFTIRTTPGTGFTVSLRLPARRLMAAGMGT